jgi:hypothetical protein
MIRDEMWDKAIITLKNEERSPTWLCFQNRERNEDGHYTLNENAEIFSKLPRITLVPCEILDKYRILEKASGYKIKDIGAGQYSSVYSQFAEGNIEGIPMLDTPVVRNLWAKLNPQSYGDILKVIGLAHSSGWEDNGEASTISIRKAPAYREDVFDLISEHLHKKEIYDIALAYEVMEKTWRGHYESIGGMDEKTRLALLDLNIAPEYISHLEKIKYLPPRAQGAAYLRDAIWLMYCKINCLEEYKMSIDHVNLD